MSDTGVPAVPPRPGARVHIRPVPPETEIVYAILTTRPIELRRHDISDEELEMLSETNHDGISEAFWGCLGAGLAALLAVGDPLWGAFVDVPHQPMTLFHEIEFAVAIVGLTAAVVLRIGFWGKRAKGRKLVADIRARPTD